MSSSYHDATLPLGQPEIVPEAGPEHGLQGHNFKDIMGFKSWSRKHLEPAHGKDKGKCFPPREDLEALQQESVLAADAQARQLLTLVDSSLPPTPTRQEVSMGRGMGRVRARCISRVGRGWEGGRSPLAAGAWSWLQELAGGAGSPVHPTQGHTR